MLVLLQDTVELYVTFFDNLEQFSNSTAIINESAERISYRDLLSISDDIGRWAESRSLTFLICKNSLESIAGYIGFMRIKSVIALLDSKTSSDSLFNLIETFKPRYIYAPTEKSELKISADVIFANQGYVLLETSYQIAHNPHKDLALLLSTSGSTGSPRFVRQSYKNIESNTEAIAEYLRIDNSDCPITTLSMSYTYGLSIINSHLSRGASVILTESTLMERGFWQLLQQEEATTFGGVPYTYEMLKKLGFGRMDLPSLKSLTQAGGKLSEELLVEFIDTCKRKGIKFYVMYGQTEASPRMSYLPWSYAQLKIGSIGIAIPGGHFCLEDEQGNLIEASDTSGELVYKGDNVTLGYAESYRDLGKGDENKGVLHTGDIAKRDADGFYYIVGRKKRFLKMFGNRVNLDEVEQLIRKVEVDCACSGSDDDLKIYTTCAKDQKLVEDYLIEQTSILRRGVTLVLIEEIPRSESGKILYSLLG